MFTRPRVFVRFANTKSEFSFVQKFVIFIWETVLPPTYVWEKSPPKKVFFCVWGGTPLTTFTLIQCSTYRKKQAILLHELHWQRMHAQISPNSTRFFKFWNMLYFLNCTLYIAHLHFDSIFLHFSRVVYIFLHSMFYILGLLYGANRCPMDTIFFYQSYIYRE